MKLMFDAAWPPAKAPAGFKVVAGYIGGDTPHVWTKAEWDRFNGLKKLAIFTRSNPKQADAKLDAFEALMQLWKLGVPKGSPVALDYEMAIDQAYVSTFRQIMHWAGYKLWLYGSAGTVFSNPFVDGYWVAEWDGVAANYPAGKALAKQYASDTMLAADYDASKVRYRAYLQLKAW